MNEFIQKMKTAKEPLYLQLHINARGSAGTCICGGEITDLFGILCIGGETPEDPVLALASLCGACVSKGPAGYVDLLQEDIAQLESRIEDLKALSEAVEKMPVEDWPTVPKGEE